MARTYQRVSLGGYTFKTLKNPAPQVVDVPNVVWRKTVGGLEVATKYGNAARKRGYTLWLVCGGSPDDMTTWNTFKAAIDEYSDSFTVIDHAGTTFTGRIVSASETPDPDHTSDVLVDIEVVETNP